MNIAPVYGKYRIMAEINMFPLIDVALVLLITLTAGVLISVLVSLPGLVRGKWATAGQRKKRTALELERETFRQRAEAAEKEVKELELQLASLSAELEKHLPDEVTKTLPD